MTEQIITNYFLKVGASLRNSDTWAEQHEEEPKNENAESKSRVARSGYFGVGALAAYLLGDKIKVYTRHFTQLRGIEFEARLGDEAIELRYFQGEVPIGTIIEIDITQETLYKLGLKNNFYYSGEINKWDWYCLDEPKVIRLFIDRNRKYYCLNQDIIITLKDSMNMIKQGWHEIKDTKFKNIYFNTLTPYILSLDDKIICNGIRVKYSLFSERFNNLSIVYIRPAILILDTDKQLKFDLTRNNAKLGEELERKIINKLFKYFLLLIFLYSPNLKASYNSVLKKFDKSNSYLVLYPSLGEINSSETYSLSEVSRKIRMFIQSRNDQSLIFYTSKGILINDIPLLMKVKIKKILVVYLPNLRLNSFKSNQIFNRNKHGNYFDKKCGNLSSEVFFKINYFDLLEISKLKIGNDSLAVDVISTYPSNFTSLKGIQIWIYQIILSYKKLYKDAIQSIIFIISTDTKILTKIKSYNQKEKTKISFLNFLDSRLNKTTKNMNEEERLNSDEIKAIKWVREEISKYNFSIEIEQELVIFTIGKNENTNYDIFRALHTKIKEVSEHSINCTKSDYEIDFFKKNLIKDNLTEQDKSQDIITVEISFNESITIPETHDESIVNFWLDIFGEEVIPYQDTPEYQSKRNSDKLTVLQEYIDELENINFLEIDELENINSLEDD
ncbi:hypothetical protein [Nostoc sp. MS1]|uniref:hypothetical protein n=1 Tax=Nostoc sp. MS1 TaxID=2764711 RepID=UPI001CC6C665|nr:hypothetical protein [Nostoc sp. MS1]BCL39076.1 hypothetical protein NSMS1_55230 [Nostoc sp. MS1]